MAGKEKELKTKEKQRRVGEKQMDIDSAFLITENNTQHTGTTHQWRKVAQEPGLPPFLFFSRLRLSCATGVRPGRREEGMPPTAG